MKNFKYIFFIFLFGQSVFCQNLFDEHFDNCTTDMFKVENNTIILKTKNDILEIFKNSFNDEITKSIKGLLIVQVLVDFEGNSCLLSFQNQTNIESNRLNLKNIIDENLKWYIPSEKMSAIIAINFSEIVEMRRFGLNSEKGFHELE